MQTRVELLKPLDGKAIGDTHEYLEEYVPELERMNAVKRAPVKAADAAASNKADGKAPANKSAKTEG